MLKAPVVISVIASASQARERVIAMFTEIAAPIAIGPLDVDVFAFEPSDPLSLFPDSLAFVSPRPRWSPTCFSTPPLAAPVVASPGAQRALAVASLEVDDDPKARTFTAPPALTLRLIDASTL